MSRYPDQTRNLNPTPEARVAIIVWGKEYSQQDGGSMDFWDSLDVERKRICHLIVDELRPMLQPQTPTNEEGKG